MYFPALNPLSRWPVSRQIFWNWFCFTFSETHFLSKKSACMLNIFVTPVKSFFKISSNIHFSIVTDIWRNKVNSNDISKSATRSWFKNSTFVFIPSCNLNFGYSAFCFLMGSFYSLNNIKLLLICVSSYRRLFHFLLNSSEDCSLSSLMFICSRLLSCLFSDLSPPNQFAKAFSHYLSVLNYLTFEMWSTCSVPRAHLV